MADIVAPEVRSRMMAGIRGKDTKPELIIRSGLHRAGFRFRLHDGNLPGRPDLVFRRYNAVIFVHGCFWHGHDCHLFKMPSTRTEFWKAKIERNKAADTDAEDVLCHSQWRVGIVWECSLKGRKKLDLAEVVDRCSTWLRQDAVRLEIEGTQCR